MEALGVPVLRSVPNQRGFNQPCPLWNGQCTIYHSRHYPRFCRTYKCKLLKKVLDGTTTLPQALTTVEQAKKRIEEVERLLYDSPNPNFRERLVEQLEATTAEADRSPELRRKAMGLLALYAEVFGVDDMIETS